MSYPTEQLGNLCEIVIGRTPSRSEPKFWGKGNKWVSISDLNRKVISETKEEITDHGVVAARCRRIAKGTLLLSFKLTIGKMAFAGCDLYTNEAIAALEVKNRSVLNPEFLYYALQAARFGGSNQAAMGQTLNSKSLARIQVPVPPLTDQVRIVHLLSKVEGLIARRKEHLQHLDDLLKSVFLDMFGDPVRNERGWHRAELREFGKVSTGNTPPRNDPTNYDERHIEWIKTDNITLDSVFVTPAVEHLSTIGSTRGRTVTRGALLVTCIAGSIESIGRAALTDRAVAFNQQINAIQPGADVNSLYLHGLFKMSRAYIRSYATKGMKKILTKGDFEQIKMIKPPLDLQNKFAAIVGKAESIKSSYQVSLSELENLQRSLSQKALKGELDLSRVSTPYASVESASHTVPHVERAAMSTTPDGRITLPEFADGTDLADSATRQALISTWLDAYVGQLSTDAACSAAAFVEAVNDKILLAEDEAPTWGVADHDQFKKWLFEALAERRLLQVYDESGNSITLKRAAASGTECESP
jgi:type I restriction enzyme S subunit